MLFANTFAATVDWMMEKPLAQLGTVNAWMLAVLYTLQIYFDFSGYSDMAIGLGKMFGFDLWRTSIIRISLPRSASSGDAGIFHSRPGLGNIFISLGGQPERAGADVY